MLALHLGLAEAGAGLQHQGPDGGTTSLSLHLTVLLMEEIGR